MGSMEETIRNSYDEEDNDFRRRIYHQEKCTIPRRYVLAIMLFLVFVIDAWKGMNVIYMLSHVLILGTDVHLYYPAMANWTMVETDRFHYGSMIVNICVQFPGALLIFITSSHKFLSASVAASSVLHVLTIIAVDHHSMFLAVVFFSQTIVSAPIRVAALTIWKEWAPPAERTKLMAMMFVGTFVTSAGTPLLPYMLELEIINQSFYVAGAAGLVWSLFWYATCSDTPSNDPRISENEFLYLQNNIPSTLKETSKFSQVPWKSIMTSKPVYALFLVYYKTSSSMYIISISTFIFMTYFPPSFDMIYILIPFLVVLFAVVLIGSAIIADSLIKKYRGHVLIIRKSFLCGAFSVHALLLFVAIFLHPLVTVILYVISYSIFSISVAGFSTIALDLSSRYISIIGGMIETFYALGFFATQFMIQYMAYKLDFHLIRWVFFLHEIIIAILAAGIFFIWGSVEEEPWSFNLALGRPSVNYHSYPKPDDEDDLKLTTDYL